MFLNDPHSTHRYYGELLNANRNKIFDESHSPYPYYLSALTYYSAGRYLSSGWLEPSIRPFRYHTVLLFRLLASTEDVPYLNDRKKIERYCEHLVKALHNEKVARDTFKRAELLIKSEISTATEDAENNNRTRHFTTQLIQAASRQSLHIKSSNRTWAQPSSSSIKVGTVVKYDVDRGFGFIRDDQSRTEYFVHFTAIETDGLRALRGGQRVEFYPGVGPKGPIATGVAPKT
jgi:cold shock CspA family protein